jgi:glycerol-3-phosphate dehydrogenase
LTAFSAIRRSEILKDMSRIQHDVLVIGGGITGSGIALEAASRGLKVALVEKNDFGFGTSSRSGKLIHGGLKYLKQGDLGLVKEVGRERAIVYENAKHLILPIQMLFPIVKNGSFTKLTLKVGLATYDKLAGVKPEERHTMLSKEEVFLQEPLLHRDLVSGGGMYFEYRTDDSRLTLEVVKTAFEHGASACNYAEVTGVLKDQHGQLTGVHVRDLVSQRSYKLHAKYVVNAGGPWVDDIRRLDGEIKGKRLVLSKGIHIVVPFERFPVRQSVYFDAAGRMIAVVPRDGCTYIGSTESLYQGDPGEIAANRTEVEYLLGCVNSMFPSVNLKLEHITSSWAGVRPLIHEDGKKPADLSRKDEIFVSDSGLITIAGGKLTGYRKMAERVVDQVIAMGEFPQVAARTDRIKLTGGGFDKAADLKHYIDELARRFQNIQVGKELASELVYRYGTHASKILEIMENMQLADGQNTFDRMEVKASAEARYCIEHEMAVHLSDFFIRRTGYLLFKRNAVPLCKDAVRDVFAERLNWDAVQHSLQQERLEADFRKTLSFLNE